MVKFLNIVSSPCKRVSRSGCVVIGPGCNDGPASSLASVSSALPLPLPCFDLVGFCLGRPPRKGGGASGSRRSSVAGATLGVSDTTGVS